MIARPRTAAEWRVEALRLDAEAQRAADEGRHLDAEQLYGRAHKAWRSCAAAGLAAIGGAR